MESVPETERMEAFKPSPIPSIIGTSAGNQQPPLIHLDSSRKPPTPRRSTDPNPSSSVSHHMITSTSVAYRPRTASPLSGSHSRSHSVAGLAPSMSRTQSMPGVNSSGQMLSPSLLVRPESPSGSSSPSRMRPPRRPLDESFPPTSPVRTSVLEMDRGQIKRSSSPSWSLTTLNASRLRRPSSPLRNIPPTSNPSIHNLPSTPSSVSSSPSYRAHDSFYSNYGGSLSSMPSTPTSARSRSPSISSLETIPDSPDAEEAAAEADRRAQIKAAAEALEGGDTPDSKAKANVDVPTRGRSLVYGSNKDKRKRWSVCGAERRGDLDLETIWED